MSVTLFLGTGGQSLERDERLELCHTELGIFSRGTRTRCITRLRNGVIPGHIIIIPGYIIITPGHCIIIPGHYVCFLGDMRLKRRNTRWLVVMWVVNPQKAALM